MTELEIPAEDRAKVSTRIDTLAHDILKKISIEKYGSKSNMSAVLTEAVRFLYEPTPTQRVARQKFTNHRDVYPRDPQEKGGSKVIHWRAPSELVEVMDDFQGSSSNREFLESAIYEYEAYYTDMDTAFSPETTESEEVVDWDVIEDNYSLDLLIDDVRGADVPAKPSYRRPFIYFLVNDTGTTEDGFYNMYGKMADAFDISGMPKRETQTKDFDFLVSEGYLIPTPSAKSDKPMRTVDSDMGDYYRRDSVEDGKLPQILDGYIDKVDKWIQTNKEKGSEYRGDESLYKQYENILITIQDYSVPALQNKVERAEELHMEMVDLRKSF